jgi:hypothetical protein
MVSIHFLHTYMSKTCYICVRQYIIFTHKYKIYFLLYNIVIYAVYCFIYIWYIVYIIYV